MKNLILILVLSLSFSNCVTNSHLSSASGAEGLNKDNYTILQEKQTTSRSNKFWILFIPFGGKSDKTREGQCYDRMIRQNNADGILAAKYTSRKFVIPLIVFTYSYRQTKLTGKPYILKTDSK